MITDTALFRYPYYHHSGDTPDKLDYASLARVTYDLDRALLRLTGGQHPFNALSYGQNQTAIQSYPFLSQMGRSAPNAAL